MRKLIFPILLALSGTAVLVSLGVWQVQRLQWKTEILAQIETEIVATPVALPAAPDPETDRYLPVVATGSLTGDVLHVIVSTEENGAGYRTVSAFETDGRRVLLDLGFVGFDDRDIALPTGALTVTGNLLWPDEVDGFTPDPEPSGLWFAREADAMAATLDTEPFFIVARDIQPGSPTVPMPVGTNGIPNDHLSYAVTWFLLALGWLAMSGLLIYRTLRPKEH